MIEFNMQGRLLEIYHQLQHNCQVKPYLEANDSLIEENIKKYGAHVGPKMLAQMKMTEVLKKQMDSGSFDMDEIVDIAAKMTDKTRIRNIRKKLHHQLKSEKHSISAVAELKVCTDTSEELMTTLLTVVTLREYRNLKMRIQQITSILPSLQPATEWWFARRYNLFPIFKGYCISSVNLAEIGHSTLKRAKQ